MPEQVAIGAGEFKRRSGYAAEAKNGKLALVDIGGVQRSMRQMRRLQRRLQLRSGKAPRQLRKPRVARFGQRVLRGEDGLVRRVGAGESVAGDVQIAAAVDLSPGRHDAVLERCLQQQWLQGRSGSAAPRRARRGEHRAGFEVQHNS